MRVARTFLLALALSACGPKAPVVVAPKGPTPSERLEAANAQMLAGCLDCLLQAYGELVSLRDDATVGAAATKSAIQSAILISLREQELGLLDSGHLRSARQMLDASTPLASELGPLADLADVLVSGPSGAMRRVALDIQTRALQRLSQNQSQWAALLRMRMPGDPVASYFWLSLACGTYGYQVLDGANRSDVVGDSANVALVAFKEVATCSRSRVDVLHKLRDSEPRFGEIHYFLGLAALAGQSRPGAPGMPDLELADKEFQAAYAWRPLWPAVTLSIANAALTAEDFDRAVDFYDQTLLLVPGYGDALLGKIRELTYAKRHADAIAVTDVLLDSGNNPGEARYWRALNEEQLDQHDLAWEDVELAARLLVNADVPKLAGIIAINRRDLAVARDRLELARKRRPDCDTGYYLQIVLADEREWAETARVAGETASCFDKEEATLLDEIERFRGAQNLSPEGAVKRDRQIAKREQQIAGNARMRANAWFNAAASSFNLGRASDARGFAEKVADDAQFGERARDLIARLAR
jgi:tetratricopeptide (TPR) repeat protein